MVVTIALDEVKATQVTIDYSAFGNFSIIVFKTKLNLFFTTFKIFINKWLSALTIVFPSNIGGVFELSNLNIIYFNNYLYCGATPTFIGEPSVAFALHHYLTEDAEHL